MCYHESPELISRYLKLSLNTDFSDHQTMKSADNVENLILSLKPSSHIFAGIGQTFRNLKILALFGGHTLKFIRRSDFNDLPDLEELSLFNTEFDFIPEDTFWNLLNLKTLKIINTKLIKLPRHLLFGLGKLEEFKFHFHSFVQIPFGFLDHSKNIKKLHLERCELFVDGETTWDLPNLEEIYLAWSNLVEIPAKFLANSNKLKTLNLVHSRLANLGKEFQKSVSNLEDLKLSGNPIELSFDSFSELRNLRNLSLATCNIRILPQSVFEPLIRLETLDLSHNQLAFLQWNVFADNLQLREINLKFNSLTRIDVDFLHIPKLRFLDLTQNFCIDEVYNSLYSTTLLMMKQIIDRECSIY